ncbi:MAG: alternate-type signal peptide domain-containing protein [Nocardioidaceae bacterium]|jgi:alternate signal-mediated exported protein|nr:alternate-type signal peptide domain-containing protein [Nocardioidaceae bacterium]
MNATPKKSHAKRGAIAAGLGLALLTGVGGTFAYWSQSTNVGSGDITAGNLSLAVSGDAWYDCTANGTSAATDTTTSPVGLSGCSQIIDITAFRIVPGDKLKYVATATPTLVGDNIKADLTATLPATGSGTDLTKWITVAAGISGSPTGLTEADSGNAKAAIVALQLPSSVANQDGVTTTASLTDFKLNLVQVP